VEQIISFGKNQEGWTISAQTKLPMKIGNDPRPNLM
jgi:hypothetical protein